MSDNALDTTLGDLFQRTYQEGGATAVPVSVTINSEGKSQYLLVVQGEHELASLIMARLMTTIDDLHSIAKQQANVAAPTQDTEKSSNGSRIIAP